MTDQTLHTQLTADLAAVDHAITQQLSSIAPLIPQLANHLLQAGGKRLRPCLTLAFARLLGYQGNAHHGLAAAVELIHSATLLHDDVVDDGQLRRGLPAAKTIWGNQASVLVGDFLFSRAFELMVATDRLEILHILATASARIAEGEVMQLAAVHNIETPTAQYFAIIEAKTATLFAAAAKSGAVLAGASAARAQQAYDFGYKLGIAFQLSDDVMDYADTRTLGKEQGNDFAQAKITLPVILYYNQASKAEQGVWQAYFSGGQAANQLSYTQARQQLLSSGSLVATAARATEYAEAAAQHLADFPDNPIRQALMTVCGEVGARAPQALAA